MVFSLIAISLTILLTFVVLSFVENLTTRIHKKKAMINFEQPQQPVIAIK